MFRSALSHKRYDPEWEAQLVELLSPHLSSTHSLPSVAAPPCAGYGSFRIERSDRSRQGFLEEARRLLKESTKGGVQVILRETYAVRFRWNSNAERSVFLSGSFNEWGIPVPMKKTVKDGVDVWECVLRLRVGEYRYKYVVDGEWRVDDSRLCERVDGKPTANLLIVEAPDRSNQ